MKKYWCGAAATVAAALVLLFHGGAGRAKADNAKQSFGFNAPLISGFPNRMAEITGGGAYQQPAFAHAGGSFRCLSDISAPPSFFAGCLAGQGVRWDTAMLLDSTTFKCTGAAGEMLKTANTGDKTVVLMADFYRQGDGNEESFTARMIVSTSDIAPDIPGTQNVWIQGIGCGEATVSFN